MHVNKTKFERNSFPEYYHLTWLGKQNIQDKEVYLWCLYTGCAVVNINFF